MSPHRGAAIGAAVIVLSSLIIVGCAPGPVSTTEAKPAHTATAAPTPTADPRAVVAFDGDCAAVFTVEEVTEAVGLPMDALAAAWSPGSVARLGGTDCAWTTSEQFSGASVRAWAYPADIAEQVSDEPGLDGCESDGEWTYCAATSVVGDIWVSVSVGAFSLAFEPADDGRAESAAEQLHARIAARAEGLATPRAAVRGERWWSDLDCAGVVADLIADGALPPTSEVRLLDGRSSPQASLPESHGLRLSCVLEYDADAIGSEFALWPGGGESFPEVAALEQSASIDVPGAEAAEVAPSLDALEGHYPELVVTDGDNMLSLPVYSMNGMPEVRDIEFATALLEALTNH